MKRVFVLLVYERKNSMGIVKDVKNRFRKIFRTSEKPEEKYVNKQKFPGTQEEKKDISGEVFERTGHIREGVGQSSTKVQRQNVVPQNEPIKKHGIVERGIEGKERKFHEKQRAKKDKEVE